MTYLDTVLLIFHVSFHERICKLWEPEALNTALNTLQVLKKHLMTDR